MSKIFLSYRRNDSQDVVGRIYDHLVSEFGRKNVFKDVDSIPAGVDFRTHIGNAVQSCDVVLAVIGKTWLESRDTSGNRRLDDPDDFVRIEIESGLGRNIPVIPVLVANASMPPADKLPLSISKLAYQNALKIRPDPDFRKDIDKLYRSLSGFVKPRRSIRLVRYALLLLFVAALIGIALRYDLLTSSYKPDAEKSEEPAKEKTTKFFGALDGIYESVGEKPNNQLTISNSTNQLELLVGNCSFTGEISQDDNFWRVIAKGQDGMCDMVDDPFIDKEVGRITPVKGRLANSGRVMTALVNFSIGSLSGYSGIYEFKYNDLEELRRSLGYDK